MASFSIISLLLMCFLCPWVATTFAFSIMNGVTTVDDEIVITGLIVIPVLTMIDIFLAVELMQFYYTIFIKYYDLFDKYFKKLNFLKYFYYVWPSG